MRHGYKRTSSDHRLSPSTYRAAKRCGGYRYARAYADIFGDDIDQIELPVHAYTGDHKHATS